MSKHPPNLPYLRSASSKQKEKEKKKKIHIIIDIGESSASTPNNTGYGDRCRVGAEYKGRGGGGKALSSGILHYQEELTGLVLFSLQALILG